jgi:hypothetical protein
LAEKLFMVVIMPADRDGHDSGVAVRLRLRGEEKDRLTWMRVVDAGGGEQLHQCA